MNADLLFQNLAIGTYFAPVHPQYAEYPLFQKTTNFHANRFHYDGLGNLVTQEVPFFPDDCIYDCSEPLDRRRVILQKGDHVVVPIYQAVAAGTIVDILPATKNALVTAFQRFRTVWNNKHIADKKQYLWGFYSSDKFRLRVKVLLDGASKSRCMKAKTMYRARLALY